MRIWKRSCCSYNLKMNFSSRTVCTFILIVGCSSILFQSSSASSIELKLKPSMYKDTTSDPNFPWMYARAKRQIFGEQIPKHRPLSGNIYSEHAGFPHPGRWHKPGTVARGNPNSGHHFDNPNVILSEEDFQRYGSTLQHLENQHKYYGMIDPPSQIYGPGPSDHSLRGGGGHEVGSNGQGLGLIGVGGQGYGHQLQPRPVYGPGPSSSGHAANGISAGGHDGAEGGQEEALVHHQGGDLPVRILHHHHWHPPIYADPISHPIDPSDQAKLVAFNQIGVVDQGQTVGTDLAEGGHGALAVPENNYGHGALVVPESNYGHGGEVQVVGHNANAQQVPIDLLSHNPRPIFQQVLPITENVGGYGISHSHGHSYSPPAENPIYQSEPEIVHQVGNNYGHGQGQGHIQIQGHGHGYQDSHSNYASLKNKPLAHLLNFHNLIFGSLKRPTNHVPILKGLWPSMYGKWRNKPFSWSFNY